MKPVAVRPVVITAVLIAVMTGIVMQLLRNGNASLPQHSWWEVVIVAIATAALLAAGWRVRRYVVTLRESRKLPAEADRSATANAVNAIEPVGSSFARGTLVAAQAAALGGGALVGWYVGQAVIHASRWQTDSGRAATTVLLVLAVMGVALSAAGFRVQKWCTLPDDRR